MKRFVNSISSSIGRRQSQICLGVIALLLLLHLFNSHKYSTCELEYNRDAKASPSTKPANLVPTTTAPADKELIAAATSTNTSHMKVLQTRQDHLTSVCQSMGRNPPSDIQTSMVRDRMLVQPVHDILYCPVEKVASTFWKQTLQAMMSRGKYTSPFKMKVKRENKMSTFQTFRNNSNLTMVKEFKQQAESLLVVRDPYEKLFSAYTDKLFHPNFLFWKAYGEPIKLIIRKYRNPNSDRICGNDVTFSEFIRYIFHATQQNMELNPHFTPIYRHCDPCETKYTYISKLETLKSDFFYIINHWNTKFDLDISVTDFEQESAINIARSHIKLSFSTEEKFGKLCNMRPYLFLQRSWRFLQITGIISKDFPLPYPDDGQARLVTEEDFVTAVENVLLKQQSWEIVKAQRKEALLEAYGTLGEQELEQLRKLLLPDRRFFDYEDRPPQIFNMHLNKNSSTTNFQYFDII